MYARTMLPDRFLLSFRPGSCRRVFLSLTLIESVVRSRESGGVQAHILLFRDELCKTPALHAPIRWMCRNALRSFG